MTYAKNVCMHACMHVEDNKRQDET